MSDLPAVRMATRGRKRWELVRRYKWEHDGHTFEIPAGFRFDLASVPRAFWRVVAPFELSLAAPLVHDWLYRHRGQVRDVEGEQVQITRRTADRIFLALMRDEGVLPWRRAMAYRFVRWFAPRWR